MEAKLKTLNDAVRAKFQYRIEFAKAAGWHHTKVSRMLNGQQRTWSQDDVETFAKLVGMSVYTVAKLTKADVVLQADDETAAIEPLTVDGAGYVGSRHEVPDALENPWRIPIDDFQHFSRAHASECALIRVEGHTSAPIYNHGDFLVVDRSITQPAQCADYLIQQPGFLEMKTLELLPGQDKVKMYSIGEGAVNAHKIKVSDLVILGRVIAHFRPR